MNQNLLLVALLVIILLQTSWLVWQNSRPLYSRRRRMMLIDTSVLIDGRIVPVAASGFLSDTLLIPRSVVGELQYLADNADAEKRSRARHGLDVINELQSLNGVTVEIYPDSSRTPEGVDQRLLMLSKKLDAVLCTIDFNLNKVARVEGITVLNINELAQHLRMSHLPGEKMTVEVVAKGQDAHQGVGYMPDGTMVVIEQASGQVGSLVEIEIIRSLQTAAGRMMFARLIGRQTPQKNREQRVKTSRAQNNTQPASKTPVPKESQTRSRNPHTSKRKPTSSDRESALIDLIDNSSKV